MLYSNGILNDMDQPKHSEQWRYMVFWRHLKRFGTAEKTLKTWKVNRWYIHSNGKWCILYQNLKRFGTAEIISKHGRVRVYFDTFLNDIWNCNEKNSTSFDFIKEAWILDFFL